MGRKQFLLGQLVEFVNNYDVAHEYGLSVLDAYRRINLTASVELPFGRSRLHGSGFADAIAGGWMLSTVGSYQSGFPVSLQQSPNNSNLLGSTRRPNVVDGANPCLTSDPGNATIRAAAASGG